MYLVTAVLERVEPRRGQVGAHVLPFVQSLFEVFPPDGVIGRQGDPGDKCYLIRRGEVQLIKDGRPLLVLGKGDFMGDRALVTGEPRLATGQAVGEVELYTMDRDTFVKNLDVCKPFIKRVLEWYGQGPPANGGSGTPQASPSPV